LATDPVLQNPTAPLVGRSPHRRRPTAATHPNQQVLRRADTESKNKHNYSSDTGAK
jgi:hypothetical protein